jgi:hypothetical protein
MPAQSIKGIAMVMNGLPPITGVRRANGKATIKVAKTDNADGT